MKELLVVLVLLGLSGCTFYNVDDHEDGSYVVTGHTTALKSSETVIKEVTEKANSICDGKELDVIDPATGQVNPNYTPNLIGISSSYYTTNVIGTSRSISLHFRCKENI